MSALPNPRRRPTRRRASPHLALVEGPRPDAGSRWGFVLRGILTTLLIGAAVAAAAVALLR